MALKAVLGSLDDLPGDVGRLYAERDGRFVLEVEAAGGLALENVAALKDALSKERVNARKARRRLAVLDAIAPRDARLTPEAAPELRVTPASQEVVHATALTAIGARDEMDLCHRIGSLARSLERALLEALDIAAVLAQTMARSVVAARRPAQDHQLKTEESSTPDEEGAATPSPLPSEA
jgi:hypothetical protein